jgi:hypothetical protein
MKANTIIGHIFAAVVASGLLTALGLTAARAQTFSFEGYGNPQRPFPGYVGEFQLGPVKISGSGELRETDGTLIKGGVITHTDDLKDKRYPNHKTTFQVVKGGTLRNGPSATMFFEVQVVTSNYPDICPVGTKGTFVIIDDQKTKTMPNGHKAHGIVTEMPTPMSKAPNAPCRTHNHGMTNEDVTWTDPPKGGPPSGGMWAIVNIGPPAPGLCSGCSKFCMKGKCE